LKADIVLESVTKDGNAFQTRAPATGKERSPIVVLRVGGTTSAGEDVDRSRRFNLVCYHVCIHTPGLLQLTVLPHLRRLATTTTSRSSTLRRVSLRNFTN